MYINIIIYIYVSSHAGVRKIHLQLYQTKGCCDHVLPNFQLKPFLKSNLLKLAKLFETNFAGHPIPRASFSVGW